jgi:hypothetical protein
MNLFTSEEREQLRGALVAAARSSGEISGAACITEALLGEMAHADVDMRNWLADTLRALVR